MCVACSSCCFSASPPRLAFSGEGHQIVTTIAAEKLLGTRAEREVAALLGGKSLAEVSTWADRLKRAPFDDEPASFRLRNPRQAQ